jgi:hypothetical protein
VGDQTIRAMLRPPPIQRRYATFSPRDRHSHSPRDRTLTRPWAQPAFVATAHRVTAFAWSERAGARLAQPAARDARAHDVRPGGERVAARRSCRIDDNKSVRVQVECSTTPSGSRSRCMKLPAGWKAEPAIPLPSRGRANRGISSPSRAAIENRE